MALKPLKVGLAGLSASSLILYAARDSDLYKGGPRALLGTVICLVVAQNKELVLAAAKRVVDAPLQLASRLAGAATGRGDDGAGDAPPPLARLAPPRGGAAAEPADAWPTDAHPRFAAAAPGAAAYAACRHDLGVCARRPPPEASRAWDPHLGAVPEASLARWRAAAAERRPTDASAPPPPPRTPRRVVAPDAPR